MHQHAPAVWRRRNFIDEDTADVIRGVAVGEREI